MPGSLDRASDPHSAQRGASGESGDTPTSQAEEAEAERRETASPESLHDGQQDLAQKLSAKSLPYGGGHGGGCGLGIWH